MQISDDRLLDLLLVSAAPVSRTRLLERRSEIDAVYASLTSSNVVIITLGMVEAWYDREDGLYLNQMPPPIAGRGMPSRYEFRVLDAEDALPLLGESLGALIDAGVPKILLTVSPVPLNTTFDGKDCFIANTYSKSVLRVCAERLMRRFPEVDYFPSYEIVSSGGLAGV